MRMDLTWRKFDARAVGLLDAAQPIAGEFVGLGHIHADGEPARVTAAKVGDLTAGAFNQAQLIAQCRVGGAFSGRNGERIATLRGEAEIAFKAIKYLNFR